MNQRNRLTPISLTREYPVTEFVIRYFFAESFFFCFFCEDFSAFCRGEPFKISSINENAIFCKSPCSIMKYIPGFFMLNPCYFLFYMFFFYPLKFMPSFIYLGRNLIIRIEFHMKKSPQCFLILILGVSISYSCAICSINRSHN